MIGVFFGLPVLAALLLSLTDFDLYALADVRNLRFIGLTNYFDVLQAPLFWKSLLNTSYFVVVGVPLSIAASLGAALLLNSPLARAKGLFRTALFAPVVTTVVAVALIWKYLFHTRYGLINYTLAHFGIDPIDWLGDPHYSMPAIIIFAVWKNFGYNMITSSWPDCRHPDRTVRGPRASTARRHGASSATSRSVAHAGVAAGRHLTMAGYFQLFAEPCVADARQSRCKAPTVSCTMYRGRFHVVEPRSRVGDRIPAVRADLVVARACCCGSRGAVERGGMNPRLAPPSSGSVLIAVSAIVLFPLLWMPSVSFVPGRWKRCVSAAVAAGTRHAGELRGVRACRRDYYSPTTWPSPRR